MSGLAPAAGWPIWSAVLLCGAANQILKLLAALLVQRRLVLTVLFESVGLPSLHAATMTCCLTLVGTRGGWETTAASLALVMAAVVIHDAVRFRGHAQEQRTVLYWLMLHVEDEERQAGAMGRLLRVWAHRPFHVVAGVLFGLLFALAWPGAR